MWVDQKDLKLYITGADMPRIHAAAALVGDLISKAPVNVNSAGVEDEVRCGGLLPFCHPRVFLFCDVFFPCVSGKRRRLCMHACVCLYACMCAVAVLPEGRRCLLVSVKTYGRMKSSYLSYRSALLSELSLLVSLRFVLAVFVCFFHAWVLGNLVGRERGPRVEGRCLCPRTLPRPKHTQSCKHRTDAQYRRIPR